MQLNLPKNSPQAVISDILLAIELYMAPCIYSAMVAARDQATGPRGTGHWGGFKEWNMKNNEDEISTDSITAVMAIYQL